MKITLFVPVLNEINGMKETFLKIPKTAFDQILVIDGGSTDGSAEWAAEQGCDVYRQKKSGLRHAYIEGWALIRNEYVLTFSPDGNCKPEDMLPLIEKIKEGYDMVIGSRYYQHAKSEDDDVLTGFGNWFFTTLINVLFRGKYTDVMNIYRIYKTRLFTELDLHLEQSYAPEKFFGTVVGIEPLLSLRAAKRGLKMADVPADEPKRTHGVRKLQIFRWGMTHLLQVLRELYFWKG